MIPDSVDVQLGCAKLQPAVRHCSLWRQVRKGVLYMLAWLFDDLSQLRYASHNVPKTVKFELPKPGSLKACGKRPSVLAQSPNSPHDSPIL